MSRLFRHIVFFQFNESVTDKVIGEITAGLKACALALPGTRAYECGPDIQRTNDTKDRFDFALVADFDDEAAWKVYDLDAEHNRLRADLIAPVLASRAMVQYWTA